MIGSQRCDLFTNRTIFFALNHIFFSAYENWTVKQNNQSDFKAFFKLTNHIAGKLKTKKPLFGKFVNIGPDQNLVPVFRLLNYAI